MTTLDEVGARLHLTRRRLAWAVPVVVAGMVIAGAAVATSSSSATSPNLPARSVAQLLTAVQGHPATSFSGEIHESAALGLPSLPGDQSSASLSLQSLVTGSHDVRVWSDGPAKQRLALIGQLSEADVIHNGSDVWTYTSDTNTVTHTTLPRHSERSAPATPAPSDNYSPAAATQRLLKAITPSTAVSVGTSQQVAGRDAYTLVLRPRDTESTISKVSIAIDATKFIPLRVAVYATGSGGAAFDTAFTSISFNRPAARVFNFHPPKGAKIAKNPFADEHDGQRERKAGQHPMPQPGTPRAANAPGHAKIIGSGWTSVVELPAGAAGATTGTLQQLSSPVGSAGERLVHTRLVNVVIMGDGRVFAGAVSPTVLEHIAATTR